MNDAIYQRYRKVDSEAITVQFYICDHTNNYHFLVSGSTGTKYKVTINPKTGTINCSCPDQTYCDRNECICKHCLYVLIKTLKLFDNTNHAFYKRLKFTSDEMSNIKRNYTVNCKRVK